MSFCPNSHDLALAGATWLLRTPAITKLGIGWATVSVVNEALWPYTVTYEAINRLVAFLVKKAYKNNPYHVFYKLK